MPDPEQLARQEIDALLGPCGWVVQDKSAVNLAASRGVAVRELSFKDRRAGLHALCRWQSHRHDRGQTGGPFADRRRRAVREVRQGCALRDSRLALASAFLLRVHRHGNPLHQSSRSRAAQPQRFRLSPSRGFARMGGKRTLRHKRLRRSPITPTAKATFSAASSTCRR